MENQSSSAMDNQDNMKTLTEVMTKAVKGGYVENFSIKRSKLYAPSNDHYFEPSDVSIVNFYRFEGASNPADMDILYVIETSDGVKGILSDAYGPYANAGVNDFIKEVEDIHKKNPRH